jgi:pyrimidine-specific ribonucleoside hydrolase
MRAISLLLALPEITIKAFIISDGSLPPNEGARKISSLINEFNLPNIPVVTGQDLKGIDPPWREFNRKVEWGKEAACKRSDIKGVKMLFNELVNTDEKVILVCLGPLTNVAQLIAEKDYNLTKIERIIWYNDSPELLSGFNYECDKNAANVVVKSGLRITIISNLASPDAFFDATSYQVCLESSTPLGHILNFVHSQESVQSKLTENHFSLCDELVAIYLTNPELFDISPMMNNLNVRYNSDFNAKGVKEAMYDMINGIYVLERNVVFNRFPVEREMFNYDVRPIVDSAIARYGLEEWKANVMTDEFHGHLGVFSIVGAKMGIRAREYFGVGADMLKVIAFAGTKPPYSCLIDGIQVSTGATLGMGTIELANDSIVRPSAVFTYKGHSVRLTLKKVYLERVDADIKEGIVKFGLMDEGYWKLIRRNALKYWLEWDRNIIFDVEVIN